ncbi:ABC transporter substrate-binding protein [Pseudoroseomonas globiformis]|uniref:ABC transporter substrate-binding protein n=1 Tax=Teichococcus globiformis TaxID=2307229 RepID=A0ABV7G5E4_9PROT
MRRAALTAFLALTLLGSPIADGVAQTPARTTLRYVPVGDLRVLDPIWTSAAITLIHAQLVYDVLVTMDSKMQPQLQMAESYTKSSDGLRWSFTLRPGLVFHDGSPVRARDVAASIRRWGERVTAGQALMSHVASISPVNDRTLEILFSRPFGPVLEALASPILAPFVMREQEANTDAFTQIRTVIGSGPFMFVPEAFRAGDRALYRRFPGYVPRSEPADGYAGGKVAKIDEVEWKYLPDSSTATQALQTGEVDLLESFPADLQPLLEGRQDIKLQVLNSAGLIGTIRPNTAHPPFNDARARQALLLIVDQAEFAGAIAAKPELARACLAVFVCGTPYATEVASAPWARTDFARARQLLAEAGYKGEPVVLLDPVDQPDIHMIAQLTADALRRAGVTVDVQAMDWSTLITRRNTREAPSLNPAGWHLAFTFWGGFSLSSPLHNTPLVSSCDGKNLYGWPCDAEIERLRAAFFSEATQEGRMRIIEALQARYYETVPYVSTGIYQRSVAYRSNLHGVLTTPYPVMWNIEKR